MIFFPFAKLWIPGCDFFKILPTVALEENSNMFDLGLWLSERKMVTCTSMDLIIPIFWQELEPWVRKISHMQCLFTFFQQIFYVSSSTGLEIIEQVPDVEAVVIPVGGGGLIAGCSVALKTMKPNIRIIVS